MGLFSIFKKPAVSASRDTSTLMYDLLFCDNLNLYMRTIKEPWDYPWSLLLPETATSTDYQKVINDHTLETRVRLLAYNKLRQDGHKTSNKELMGVIIEVGMESGLDVLASFKDGSARYLNHSGKILVWDTPDEQSENRRHNLFSKSEPVIQQLSPWEKPRLSPPRAGVARISFLVADGLYFSQAPVDELFKDMLVAPAMNAATHLMLYMTENAMKRGK